MTRARWARSASCAWLRPRRNPDHAEWGAWRRRRLITCLHVGRGCHEDGSSRRTNPRSEGGWVRPRTRPDHRRAGSGVATSRPGAPGIWTLVRRLAASGGVDPGDPLLGLVSVPRRLAAGVREGDQHRLSGVAGGRLASAMGTRRFRLRRRSGIGRTARRNHFGARGRQTTQTGLEHQPTTSSEQADLQWSLSLERASLPGRRAWIVAALGAWSVDPSIEDGWASIRRAGRRLVDRLGARRRSSRRAGGYVANGGPHGSLTMDEWAQAPFGLPERLSDGDRLLPRRASASSSAPNRHCGRRRH